MQCFWFVRRAIPYLLLGLLTLLVAAAVGIGLRDQPSANNGTATSGVADAAASPITDPTPLTIPTTTTMPPGAVVSSTDIAPCRSAAVQITTPVRFGAAGTDVLYLQLVNVGSIPCSLEGYPKVLGLNSAGLPVAQAVEHDLGIAWDSPYPQPPIVVLAPGEAAHATVFGNDYDFYGGVDGAANCPFYPALSVTLPGDDVAKVISMTISGGGPGFPSCGGEFNVNFVRPYAQ